MANGGAGRCLSDLSDDLLRHILFLAPDRDGAATAVLSRRWRWLWRTSGAVHLDSRSFLPSREQKNLTFLGGGHGKEALAKLEREAFVHGAEKAIAAAAAHGPIRRLTFSIAEDSEIKLLTRWWSKEGYQMEHNSMEALVSNPAARRVEELQIIVRALNTGLKLSFGTLPFEALRLLRIISCGTLPLNTIGAATRAFPMLKDLHLENCGVSLDDLQRIIHIAPLLSKLHLASSSLSGRLLIPAVSVLELEDCRYGDGLELEAPRLQFFRYRGQVNHSDRLSLKSQASDLRVDLQLTHGAGHCFSQVPTTTRESFWRFFQSFNTTKHLKLRLDCFAMNGLAFFFTIGPFTRFSDGLVDGVAFIDKASRDELLGGLSLSLLEQLELEAEYYTGFEPLLANFLHCCPMVRDLRIKLIKKNPSLEIKCSIDNNEAGVQFDKSVSGFRNRRRSRSMVSLGQEYDDNNYQDYGFIPDLTSEQSFSCLQSHLQRVSLHFFTDKPNCLGVKLAKFFAKNAMVLQELHIDDGSHELLEHANTSVRTWIANTDIYGNNQLNVKD